MTLIVTGVNTKNLTNLKARHYDTEPYVIKLIYNHLESTVFFKGPVMTCLHKDVPKPVHTSMIAEADSVEAMRVRKKRKLDATADRTMLQIEDLLRLQIGRPAIYVLSEINRLYVSGQNIGVMLPNCLDGYSLDLNNSCIPII